MDLSGDAHGKAAVGTSTISSNHPMNSESQEKGLDTCLKCGKRILHIPYKYNGQTFHARCLVCNHCGNKLVGKPFITDKNWIFCGDLCKQSFEQNPPTTTVSRDNKENEGNGDSCVLNESLEDALASISESEQAIMRLNWQASPLNPLQDPDRITDYPRRTSPSVSLHSLNSRRSSLSAMSQSSFTSDSSFDASKKPGKKILKNPHHQHGRSKNRVRWKLPNSDSDTLSVDSFESSSTVSHRSYNRAKFGVSTVIQNWREFEKSPPRGSTGITPIKPAVHQLRGSLSTGTLPMHQYSPPSHLTTIPQGAVISDLDMNASQTWTVPQQTPSPLRYNTSSNNSLSPGGALHSTPLRHTQSTSAVDVHSQLQLRGGNPNSSIPSSNTDAFSVSILRLDKSNLTDLEESTLEDRQRMHIFKFPQSNHPAEPRAILQPPNASKPKQSAPSTSAVSLEDDDANDYDHLSPLFENEGSNNGMKNKSDADVYSDKSINDAKEPSSGHSTLLEAKTLLPPSLPPKKYQQRRNFAAASEAIRNVHQVVPIRPIPMPSAVSIQAQRQPAYHNERSSPGDDIGKKTVTSPEIPPPLPPKIRRRTPQNILPSSNQSMLTAYMPKSNQVPEENVVPPPLDRHRGVTRTSPSQSRAVIDHEEDPMSSVSNSTLVEQEDATLKDSKLQTKPSPPTAASVHPATSHHPANKQPWSVPEHRERIAAAAEDSGPKRLKTSASQFQAPMSNFIAHHQFSQGSQFSQDPTFFPVRRSQPDPRAMDFTVTSGYGQQEQRGQTSRASEEQLTVPTAPRYKISVAPSKHSTNVSQSQDRSMTNNQSTYMPQHSMPRSNTVGQISRPVTNSTLEEQKMRQRFNSVGKLSVEKPATQCHVQDQSIEQLLRELEITDEKQAASVTCKVCKKSIQGSSYTMHGENYHSRCYKCIVCGSVLRGKKAFTVNHRLFCKDCHARNNFPSAPEADRNTNHQGQYRRNFQPSHDIQMKGLGRQMTSV